MNDLISKLVERRVQGLAYKGMSDLNEELSRTLGLPVFTMPEGLKRAIAIIEFRNLIVHNRSVVNAIFLSRVGTKDLKRGVHLPLGLEALLATKRFLAKTVSDVDEWAAVKFKLSRPIHRKNCGL